MIFSSWEFRHLGHVITNRLTDDDDINREVRNVYENKCLDATVWQLFGVGEADIV